MVRRRPRVHERAQGSDAAPPGSAWTADDTLPGRGAARLDAAGASHWKGQRRRHPTSGNHRGARHDKTLGLLAAGSARRGLTPTAGEA